MKTKAQNIRLGLFLVTGFVIVIFVVGYFTAQEIFRSTDTYFISYRNTSVNGLEVGSPVKFLGIKVGTIADVRIDPQDISEIVVKIELDPDTPIKKDAVADIVMLGITGMKAIEIRGGSEDAPFIKENDYIKSGQSLAASMTGKAENIALKTEQVLNNLQLLTNPDKLENLFNSIDEIYNLIYIAKQTVYDVDSIIIENRVDIRNTVVSANEASQDLKNTISEMNRSVDNINSILEENDIEKILKNTADITETINNSKLSELIAQITLVAEQTNILLSKIDADLNRGSQDFSESLRLLKLSLRNLNEAARKINSDPSVLIRGNNTSNDNPDERINE